jgi:ribonuclease BN (tRNA processing enzyme)
MKVDVYTWGTGGAFGRELGTISAGRKRRDHSAVSVIGTDSGQNVFHFMVDAGAPCVESMIDHQISACPELLFITHTHNDHVSDFDKLVNSRKRGLRISQDISSPLYIISSPLCADDPVFGLKTKFGYLGDSVKFLTVPYFDVWYSANLKEGRILPSRMTEDIMDYPVEFKLLPVYHASHAPGACMYIFRIKENGKRIAVSGDFETIEDRWLDNVSLKDPDILLIETNTINASGTGHTNWQQNMKLLGQWLSADSKSRVLLTHLSGFEDWSQRYYTHIPTDEDWLEAIGQFHAPEGARIEIAEDGMCFTLHQADGSKHADDPADIMVECKHEKTRIEGLGVNSPCFYEGVEVCEQCGNVIGAARTKNCSECPYDGDVCYDMHRWFNR